MAHIQELVIDALAKGALKQNDVYEMPVDRIAALAWATRDTKRRRLSMISSLRHLQACGAERDLIGLREALARDVFGKRRIGDTHRKLIEAVILEREKGACLKCRGRGLIIAEAGVRRTCSACNGTKVRRYSDADRARTIGVDRKEYQRWERWFSDAHSKLSAASRSVDQKCNRMLGR
jgi:hypothetical protein